MEYFAVFNQDWLQFTLNETSCITIETSGTSGDTEMWLYDEYLNEVDYNDDNGVGTFSRISRVLPPGTYYIKISEYGDDEVIDSYDTTFTAEIVQYVLTTNVEGQGNVILDPPGGTYDEGTEVTLTAAPADKFNYWEGDISGGYEYDNPLTIIMDSNKTVTAVFSKEEVCGYKPCINDPIFCTVIAFLFLGFYLLKQNDL